MPIEKNSKGVVTVTAKKNLVDIATGEVFESYVITKQYNGDQHFKKLFLAEVLGVIDEISNAKMKLLIWLFENSDKQNKIFGSYEQIAEKSGASFSTVARLIPILIKTNVLKVVSPSVYVINPELCTSLNTHGRQNLLIEYKEL